MNELIDNWEWYDNDPKIPSHNKAPWIRRILKAKRDNNFEAAVYAVEKWRKSYSVEVINGDCDFSVTFYFKSVKECEAFASVIPHPWLVIRRKH